MERSYLITHNGVEYRAQPSVVESTMLGTEVHGIVIASLHFTHDHWHQGSGAYCLDTPYKEDGVFVERRGTAAGMDYIMQLMWVCGVEKWESIKGCTMVVLREGSDYGEIKGLAHPLEDRIFIFQDHFEKWKAIEPEEAGV